MRLRAICLVITAIAAWSLSGTLAQGNVVAWWKFDKTEDRTTVDSATHAKDAIGGNFKYVEGTQGAGLRFDGFTTSVQREAAGAPLLGDAFTIEAWVAIGAYPWMWSPIVSQERDRQAGYYFGIDSQGRVGLRLAVDGKWLECKSEIDPESKLDLGLRRWYHLVGVFDSKSGITLYRDGKPVASLPVQGKVDFAPDVDLLIGRNHRPMTPSHPIRTWATYPSWYSFDGIMDEIKIHDRALASSEIADAYRTSRPVGKPDIPPRKFPTVRGSGRFGANYTKLAYYEQWDALWKTGEYSDIVVQFDELPIKVMFWRGSRYSPCWVTENGKWMADQSSETSMNWGKRWDGPTGCCEHMSDAQCRYSHVRLIENNDARVVVHWRYAEVDVLYRLAHADPTTGWGDWADEYYTIYPDGVGVRDVARGEGGWQETIFFSQPGTKPEDNVELEALTLVSAKGESKSYSWADGYPVLDLADPIIQMTNLKSRYRPFMIFRPGSGMETFNVEVRPEYSHFPWWNHWPVAQIVSDGRSAQAADRAAHSSLAWGDPQGGAALYGLTNQPATALLPLAKSWNNPPKLKVAGKAFQSEGYNYHQRAYVLQKKEGAGVLEFELAAGPDSPVHNPAFVIKGWGEKGATLSIDGQEMRRGKQFRFGHNHTLEGSDLIVWIKAEKTVPTTITLAPEG